MIFYLIEIPYTGKEGIMSAILKEDVLRGKNKETSSKERVNKLISAIVKPSDIEKQIKTENKEITVMTEPRRSEVNVLGQYIFSSEILIEGEDSSALDEIRIMLKKELKPSSQLESIIVDRIVSSVWRLKRCLKIESRVVEYYGSSIQEYEQGFFRTRKRSSKELAQLRALKVAEGRNRIDELYRYETMLEGQTYKALSVLDKLRRSESKQEKKISRKAK